MRGIALGVAVVAFGLFLIGLGRAPFLDPPEGFHAAVAQSIRASGDAVTLRINGIRYFDKPPLLYWLMAASFEAGGVTPWTARLPSAIAAVGVAAVTARLGMLLGGPRLGLLAGLMVSTNLGIFLYARLVKPDLVFILCILLAYAGFVLAYRGSGRWALAVFYAALGLATLAKDILGALGPCVVIALFFWLSRERPLAPWVPWWGPLLAAAIAVPWYLAVERENPGFLWYTIVDNHLLNFTRQRVFPDEDVPLAAVEFVVVTAAAFLPWALAAPWAIARALKRPWPDATARLWALLALWAVVVIGFFAISPFKLPHYGLPAFPALALLVARVWDESIEAVPLSLRPRTLLVPVLVLFALATLGAAAAWGGILPVPAETLSSLDVATRNVAARGGEVASAPIERYAPILARCALVFGLGTIGLIVAVWRRAPGVGVALALATMVAFLPVAGDGMTTFARSRSAMTVTDALARRVTPNDLIAHEGPLENTGSLLLRVRGPVQVVDGLQSNLAFGATFPEARDLFWDAPRLQAAWAGSRRVFLVSGVDPNRSVVRALPAGRAHLIARGGGRWLYSNLAD
ncbi:MAG: glycosyltransferase family 39 protein [Candidatus Rokubacteria bacterium]|nr:glycosyltransferase family 39 protein [Candidatus Rokubacteria bacterium]